MTAYLHSIMPYTAENYMFQGCQFLPVFVIEADRGPRFCEYRKYRISAQGGQATLPLVLETKVIRMFPKISQSRRRPPLGPSPG